MDDKRCPACGMSVEGYQDKCECGYDFTKQNMSDKDVTALASKTSGSTFELLRVCFRFSIGLFLGKVLNLGTAGMIIVAIGIGTALQASAVAIRKRQIKKHISKNKNPR